MQELKKAVEKRIMVVLIITGVLGTVRNKVKVIQRRVKKVKRMARLELAKQQWKMLLQNVNGHNSCQYLLSL